MNRKAFTLIELLVTVSIILLMAVISIPTFSRYQKEILFRQRVEEIMTLINQAHTLAINPANSVNSYYIKIDVANKKISLIDSNTNIIKAIPVDSAQVLSLTSSNFNILSCEAYTGLCYGINEGTAPPIKVLFTDSVTNFFTLKDSDLNLTLVFKINNEPFRVDHAP